MPSVAIPFKIIEDEVVNLEKELFDLEKNDKKGELTDTIIACRTGLMNLNKFADPQRILAAMRESLDAITKQEPHLELVK